MKKLLVLLALVCSPLYAGELGISWDAVSYPYPITYDVLRDGVGVAQTGGTTMLLTNVTDGCTSFTYTVTATGAVPGNPLTSDPSLAIVSMARPTIASILFNAGGVHQIIGTNFPTNVQVLVDGVAVGTVTRLTCQLVEIPTTPGTPTTVSILNPQAAGTLTATWNLPAPMAPSNPGVF